MTDTSHSGTTSYRIDNPEEFARNMLRLFEAGGRAMSGILERPDAKVSPFSAASEVTEAAKTVTDIFANVVVLIDPTQLELALINLAINARDAMPSGGTFAVSAANRSIHVPDSRVSRPDKNRTGSSPRRRMPGFRRP